MLSKGERANVAKEGGRELTLRKREREVPIVILSALRKVMVVAVGGYAGAEGMYKLSLVASSSSPLIFLVPCPSSCIF